MVNFILGKLFIILEYVGMCIWAHIQLLIQKKQIKSINIIHICIHILIVITMCQIKKNIFNMKGEVLRGFPGISEWTFQPTAAFWGLSPSQIHCVSLCPSAHTHRRVNTADRCTYIQTSHPCTYRLTHTAYGNALCMSLFPPSAGQLWSLRRDGAGCGASYCCDSRVLLVRFR